eukprot:TRINITY_DN5030_c0_g1_i3.p1 TRINITY_DN5030_c0_g1~~TRINITY_DN5030_c0_g1_i3.p1  ORF type:complete len:205 (-),score=34.32 TRINITY_DN5030_c0_g1_i3:527-1141(-)
MNFFTSVFRAAFTKVFLKTQPPRANFAKNKLIKPIFRPILNAVKEKEKLNVLLARFTIQQPEHLHHIVEIPQKIPEESSSEFKYRDRDNTKSSRGLLEILDGQENSRKKGDFSNISKGFAHVLQFRPEDLGNNKSFHMSEVHTVQSEYVNLSEISSVHNNTLSFEDHRDDFDRVTVISEVDSEWDRIHKDLMSRFRGPQFIPKL